MTAEMEQYQTLTRSQKVKKVLPKVIQLLLLSVILPTADVWTDLAFITRLYKGVGLWDCVERDRVEYSKCQYEVGADQYCTPEKVAINTICGVSQYSCTRGTDFGGWREYNKCKNEAGPDKYCNPEKVSNKNTACVLKNSFESQYFCRYHKIWSSEWKDARNCSVQGADKYCSDPASNQNLCRAAVGLHPKTALSLLFFLLLNYVMGLTSCIRLEGRNWVPLLTALFNVYPQYCKLINIFLSYV